MKFLKLYAAIFGALALFNGNLALKMRAPEDQKVVSEVAQITAIPDIKANAVEANNGSAIDVKSHYVEDLKIEAAVNEEASLAKQEINKAKAQKEELKRDTSDESRVAQNGVLFGTGMGTKETVKELIYTLMSRTICFSDLGVNSEGIIVGVGLDSELYVYDFANAIFVKLETEYHIANLWRVDINYDGVIYVVTRCGDTYYLDCELRWVKLPGCAIDIGAGRSGEIHKLGCDHKGACTLPEILGGLTTPSSNHVYKLICSCNCKCCDRRCKIFIKKHTYKTCEPAEKRVCYWIRLPNDILDGFKEQEFTRIDTKITGFPIVTDGKKIWEFIGGDENRFPQKPIYTHYGHGTIKDIATDNDGNIFFATEFKIYILLENGQAKHIKPTSGSEMGASNISVGPYGMFSFINRKFMYTTAIQGYNQLP